MREDASTRSRYVEYTVTALLDALLTGHRRPAGARSAPWLVGLSGLPGSGKSTLAQQLARTAQLRGMRTTVLSLDDFYLPRRARRQLANATHPLLATRGVPGTHDIALLMAVLDALPFASTSCPVCLPRFDKGRDTRLRPSRWQRVSAAPDLILLEGWCVGVPPQAPGALRQPINALERDEDHDGIWRRWVNAQLGGAYAVLWRRIARLALLQAPDFNVIERWRGQAERNHHGPHVMDSIALRRFLMHYERLARHSLKALPRCADVRLMLGRDRQVLGLLEKRA